MFPPTNLKTLLVYDLCSLTVKFHEAITTLEHGIWGKLNLCSWALVTHLAPNELYDPLCGTIYVLC